MATPAPTISNVLASLRSFLTAVLPATGPDGKPIVALAAQQNRIPEPPGSSFVMMTPIRVERLRTNVDSYEDIKFTANVAGTTLNVTDVPVGQAGELRVGSIVFAAGLATPTTITALGTGTGGIGSYTVSPTQNISSRTMSAGTKQAEQGAIVTVQLDFHSADQSAGDLANTASTLLRDEYGVQLFADQDPNYGVVPLYASDARQLPFSNDQKQVETRWIVEAMLQANIVVSVPQQFADAVDLGLESVDAVFPPQ